MKEFFVDANFTKEYNMSEPNTIPNITYLNFTVQTQANGTFKLTFPVEANTTLITLQV